MTRRVETLEDEDVGLVSKWRSWFFFINSWHFIKHRHKVAHVPSCSEETELLHKAKRTERS